jgi:hypothetical protein
VKQAERRAQAVEWALQEVAHPGFLVLHNILDLPTDSLDLYGRCQQVTRSLLQAPGGARDAISAWRLVAHRDRLAPNQHFPAGLPIYWSGGVGHAALSLGDGRVVSTDIKRRGKMDVVPVNLIAERWGKTLLGAAKTINGLRVYGSAP